MAFRRFASGVLLLGTLSLPGTVRAQQVVDTVEDIASDRPEAWAVKYFTSTTLLNGLSVPRRREPGSILLGGEVVGIPFLSTEQQRVGFNGTKLEDLNKAPFFARPRITVGLPGGLAVTVAFIPPVETFGVKADLFAAALDVPLHGSDGLTVGLRAYGQTGTARAAFTCPPEALLFPAGSVQNPNGCLTVSQDVATLRYGGLELSIGPGSQARVGPHLAVAATYLDNEFRVNVRRRDLLRGVTTEFTDRTMQRSNGVAFSVAGGLEVRLGRRFSGGIDVFYTPLWVKRRAGAPREHDGLITAKALLQYQIR